MGWTNMKSERKDADGCHFCSHATLYDTMNRQTASTTNRLIIIIIIFFFFFFFIIGFIIITFGLVVSGGRLLTGCRYERNISSCSRRTASNYYNNKNELI